MIKISLEGTGGRPPVLPEPGTQPSVTVSPGRLQSDAGTVALVRLSPGASHHVPASTGEQAVVVLAGSVERESTEAGASTVLRIPPGSEAVLRALETGASLFAIEGPPPEPAGPFRSPAAIETFAAGDVAATAVHDPARGFFGMTARMLVDGPSDGARAFTVGMSTFAVGEGCHGLHRHAHAEEVFYVWRGRGVHLDESGDAHEISAGDLVWMARDEWHGFRNTGTAPVRALFCYLGVDQRADAGYTLPGSDAPVPPPAHHHE